MPNSLTCKSFRTTVRTVAAVCGAIATFSAGAALADTARARCDYYPRGDDRATASMACTFSQRQGFVTIRRQDGVTHEFQPNPNGAGYLDASGGRVSVETDPNDPFFTIYRTPSESIFVYWNEGETAPANQSQTGSGGSSASPSTTPVTYLTEVDRDQIVMQITEGEFRFHGDLERTSGNMFVGEDDQVRVMYDRGTKRVVVINAQTGTEYYNYFFSDVNEGAL